MGPWKAASFQSQGTSSPKRRVKSSPRVKLKGNQLQVTGAIGGPQVAAVSL